MRVSLLTSNCRCGFNESFKMNSHVISAFLYPPVAVPFKGEVIIILKHIKVRNFNHHNCCTCLLLLLLLLLLGIFLLPYLIFVWFICDRLSKMANSPFVHSGIFQQCKSNTILLECLLLPVPWWFLIIIYFSTFKDFVIVIVITLRRIHCRGHTK